MLHLPYEVEPDDDRPEGLALVTSYRVRASWTSWSGGAPTHNNHAATFHLEVAGATLGLTNLHLDWQHPDGRVRAIADIVERLIEQHPADLEVLCGDFNDHDDGPVAAYLEHHPRPWCDAVASAPGAVAPVTIDFLDNPRWRGRGSTERPGRFDRIYLRAGRGRPAPRVVASGLFGRRPANRFGIVPSDHYGAFVDLAP